MMTWVGYFNRSGPELTHFNIDSGLELTFFKLHCSTANPKCPALNFKCLLLRVLNEYDPELGTCSYINFVHIMKNAIFGTFYLVSLTGVGYFIRFGPIIGFL